VVWEATRGFSWRDGERLVRYGPGARHEIVALLSALRLTPFVLLTAPRWQGALPGLEEAAAGTALVPPGQVPAAAAAVREELTQAGTVGLTLVALGGGRVIDVAKALAAVGGVSCAAVPTTLSGAEMTPFHRGLAGAPPARGVRPALVVSDPALAAGGDHDGRRRAPRAGDARPAPRPRRVAGAPRGGLLNAGSREKPQSPSWYLNETFTLARYALTLPFSICRSI